MAKYRLKNGLFNCDGVPYKGGDTIEYPGNLCKAFPGRFELIESGGETRAHAPAAPTMPAKKVVAEKPKQASEKVQEAPVKQSFEGGKDVTKNFQSAIDDEMIVYRKDKQYFVADAEKPDKILNTTPLAKAEVEKFIKDFLNEGM